MEKRKTPVSTIIFYIIGIILLIVSAFMLWTAVSYTKTYLQSYDASFADMWSNSVQYIITQFLPYCGMGVICLGLGRAIKGTAPLKQAEGEAAEAEAKAEGADGEKAEPAAAGTAAVSAEQVDELVRRIDTNREVLSIKIEEKEKRDSFRIKELEKKVDGFLSDVKYINEPLEELVYKQAAGEDLAEPAAAAPSEAAAAAEEPAVAAAETAQENAAVIPQVFRVARNMTMPVCPAAAVAAEAPEAAQEDEPAAAAEAAQESAGVIPQVFRVARNMTMPACPVVAQAAQAEAAPAEAAEAGTEIPGASAHQSKQQKRHRFSRSKQGKKTKKGRN